jgi:hypothetical protein
MPTNRPKMIPGQHQRTTSHPSYEAIAGRAYRRFEERGQQHGQDIEDWLAAEKELVAEHARATIGAATNPRLPAPTALGVLRISSGLDSPSQT